MGIIKKFAPQNFNDFIALVLIVGIVLLWVFVDLPAQVTGALIVTWTLVTQYYFRRKPVKEGEKDNG